MSTRNTHRQKYPKFGSKKGNSGYKYHLNRELIIRLKEKAITDWDEELENTDEHIDGDKSR